MLFTLYKGNIVLNKKGIICEELKDLIKGVSEEDAVKWIMYVFLVADRTNDNPIKDIPEARRSGMALKIAFKDEKETFIKDAKFKDTVGAIRAYERDHYDKSQADIDLYDKKLFQFMKLLNDNIPVIIKNTHEVTGKVSYTTNVQIISTILENIIKLIIDKATVMGLKQKGKFIDNLRGGLSPNSKGKLSKKRIKTKKV